MWILYELKKKKTPSKKILGEKGRIGYYSEKRTL